MSDKTLRLHCRPECKHMQKVAPYFKMELKRCIHCSGKGYTDSVINFEDIGAKSYYRSEDKTFYIEKPIILENPFIIREWLSNEDVTSEINPTHLEVIELKECPECEKARLARYSRGMSYTNYRCGNCTDGKIEVVTQKILLNPDEYDEEIKGVISHLDMVIDNSTSAFEADDELKNRLIDMSDELSRLIGVSTRTEELKEGDEFL